MRYRNGRLSVETEGLTAQDNNSEDGQQPQEVCVIVTEKALVSCKVMLNSDIVSYTLVCSSRSLVGLVVTKSHACYLLGGTG